MADLDDELLERVARWCAEAGRQAGPAEIRRALGALGWDELLMVKALLADPPPARPLGPQALADLARGTPADVAAERERGGMYRRDEEPEAAAPEAAGGARAPAAAPRRKGAARKAKLVVRRARDRVAAPPAPAPALPLLDELQLPAGRGELERLVRRHGARRPAIVAALAAGWRRPDGAPVSDADLGALLDLHGLARAFDRRERDELLHAVRAAGGVLARAAERLGVDAAGLRSALARAGAEREAERVRDERRAELRARATLTERVRLLLADEPRLADLGLLPEFEADLRARLPEHLRALRASGGPLRPALGASLSLDRAGVDALGARLGLELGPAGGSFPAADRTGPARRPGRPGGGARAPRAAGGERPPRRRTPGAGMPTERGGRPSRGGARPARPGAGRLAEAPAWRPRTPDRPRSARPGPGRPARGSERSPAAGGGPRPPRSGSGPGRPGGGRPGPGRPGGGRPGVPGRPGPRRPGAGPSRPPRGPRPGGGGRRGR